MHFYSGHTDSITELELSQLKFRYLYLKDILTHFASFLGFPLSLYLVKKSGDIYGVLFSVGDISFCNKTVQGDLGDTLTCVCKEEILRLLSLLGDREEPIVITCENGHKLGGVYSWSVGNYDLLLILGPFRSSAPERTREESNLIGPNLHVLSSYGVIVRKHLDVEKILICIRNIMRLLIERLGNEEIEVINRDLKTTEVEDEIRNFSKNYREEILQSPFDVWRKEFLWIGFIWRNSVLVSRVLTGKGEELWNWFRGKPDSIYLLLSWIENMICRKMVEDKIIQVREKYECLLRIKERFISIKLSNDLRRVLTEITKILIHCSKGVNWDLKDKDNLRFRALINLLAQSLWKNPNLGDLELELGVRASALSHWLRRKIGISFEELKSYLQIEECARYLRKSEMSLSVIGGRVGVKTESQLSVKFKLATGYSPVDYRKLFNNFKLQE